MRLSPPELELKFQFSSVRAEERGGSMVIGIVTYQFSLIAGSHVE